MIVCPQKETSFFSSIRDQNRFQKTPSIKTLLATAAVALAASLGAESARALPVYEPFADVSAQGGTTYAIGSNLYGQTNYPTGRWNGVGISGFSGVLPTINSGNLSYTGLPASTGNSVLVQPSLGGGARLNLTNNIGPSFSSIYYSFLLKITDLTAVGTTNANNPISALCDDPREQNAQVARLGARLLTKKSGAGYVLGLGRNNTLTDYAYESTVHNVNDTVFVVVCNVLDGGTTNVSLWVNPAQGTFGANTPPAASATATLYSATGGGLNASGPQAFALLCQFATAPTAVIDDVRVGSSWGVVTGGPDIAIQPTNQTANAGSAVSFSALSFGGTGYRWQKDSVDLSNGGKISGATSPTLTISNVLAADVGNYALVISNAYGIITTIAASLAVNDPVVVTQPVSQVIMPNGSNTTLHVVAAGTPTLTYQWYKDGNPLSNGGHISGALTANLTVSSYSSADSGTYYAIVQNGLANSVTSSNSILLSTDPAITSQPLSQTNVYGSNAIFQVTVTGTPPISYQWKKVGFGDLSDGGNISGSHSNVLTISAISAADAGTYFVTVTNALGDADSAQASLVVRDPAIVSGPASTNIVAGATAVFHTVVVGTPSLTYQWYKGATILFDGGNISGASTDTLTIANVGTGDQGSYSLQVINGLSATETSSNAVLTVVQPFVITAQPTSRKVAAGATTALGVGATGTSLTYQWRFGSTDIPGATSFGYVLGNVQATNVGTYTVVIGSGGNFLTSSPATVSIVSPIRFYETNVVVIRVGSGAQTLSANGNTMSLDQFGNDGTYLSTVGIPDSGPYAMVAIGPNVVTVGANSSITGNSLSRSADGLHLSFAGYATNLTYGAALQNAPSTSVPRGIGLIDSQAHYALAIAATNGFNTAIWRGAVTDGTNNYYGHARTVGTYYFGYDATNAIIQNTWVNTRSMAIFNNNIYMVSAVAAGNGVMLISGLPTAPVTPTVLFPDGTGASDCDVSPDGNTIYLADDGGSGSGAGVQRWHFDGSTWTQLYILTSGLGGGARYVAVDYSGPNPVVFAVTTESTDNHIVRFVDTGAGSTGTVVADAGGNQTFRGIRFGPRAANLAAPTISYSTDASNNLLLNWPGPFYLQSATTVVGPYNDVVNGTRVFTNATPVGTQGYFRLRQ